MSWVIAHAISAVKSETPQPWHAPHKIDLAQIRTRIHAAGLD